MPELDDHQLLAQFAREKSEAAFGQLVQRHLNLVYSTARRTLGSAHSAEEVSQAVFVILARKANGLSPKVVLSGWLYRATRLTAANYLRGEIRRQRREQEAYMQSLLNETDAGDAWRQIAPHLDDAMDKLGPRDRDAIALRFFENKTLGEVGHALGASEDAAKMRVNRALEKLRKIFKKRGVTLSAALIAGAVSANSVHAAPAGLAVGFATAAAGGATISTTITTLVKGTMKTMAWLKVKFAVGISVAALAAGGAATVAVSQISDGGKPTVQEIIRQSQDAYAALTSYSDEGETISSIGTNPVAPHTFTIKLARPNLYRVEWKQDMGFLVQHGAAWSAGEGDFVELSDGKRAKHANGEDALSTAAGVSGGASTSVPSMFFQLSGSKLNGAMQLGKRKSDEKIDGVDCYVLTQSASGRTQTLWIGKQDFLIHRVENVISAPNMKASLAEAGRRNPQIRIPPTTVSGDARLVQTHSKIVVNQKFLPSDFAR